MRLKNNILRSQTTKKMWHILIVAHVKKSMCCNSKRVQNHRQILSVTMKESFDMQTHYLERAFRYKSNFNREWNIKPVQNVSLFAEFTYLLTDLPVLHIQRCKRKLKSLKKKTVKTKIFSMFASENKWAIKAFTTKFDLNVPFSSS